MELPKNKHLVIFDFDETLCKSNGRILRRYIPNDDIDFITPGEYSVWRETGEYELNPVEWELGFSAFTGYPEHGELITETAGKLYAYVKDPHYLVALVTGRDELEGPRNFITDNCGALVSDAMIFLCSGDPNKRMCYESLINTLTPHAITIYEDSKASIYQCEEVCAKYKIPCATVLVKDGEIVWGWRSTKGEKNE